MSFTTRKCCLDTLYVQSVRSASIRKSRLFRASRTFEAVRAGKIRRWLRGAEWILLAFLLSQFLGRSLPRAWNTLNTDFPNYYLTARLAHQGYDLSRVYEWIWLQRQKDHDAIDQRIVGMVPITPFSTLAVYPLSSMKPLVAKHWWLIANLVLLMASVFLVSNMTRLSTLHVSLIVALSFPLRVNFLYGQSYVLLLFILTLACWCYLRHQRVFTGILIGIASGLKIFPVIFLIYFLRKRDLRAFAGGVFGGLLTIAASIITFGWELHRTYLFQVLPSVLRGEGLDPYNLRAASFSSLLHRLFIYEPQLNRHPAVNASCLFPVLLALFETALLAPALLLAVPGDASPRQIRLEWAAIIFVSLALSTSASSYLFTLLILPICLLTASVRGKKASVVIALLLIVYVSAGALGGMSGSGEGWIALLAVPRLYAATLLCVVSFTFLAREKSQEDPGIDRCCWTLGLLTLMTLNIAVGLRHQKGLYADYQSRIAFPDRGYMAASPSFLNDTVAFVGMVAEGYQSGTERDGVVQLDGMSRDDHLAITTADGEEWVEQVGRDSVIMSSINSRDKVRGGESPVASPDGRWLAFLREDRGRARVWIHSLQQADVADWPITPPDLNVLEMSFLTRGELVFSADVEGALRLFAGDFRGNIRALGMEDARYPSVSPDGHWLAYSRLQHGNWNLWLRKLNTGQEERLTNAECNTIEPAWAADSQTLVYASDCGRALWFTALCKRSVPH